MSCLVLSRRGIAFSWVPVLRSCHESPRHMLTASAASGSQALQFHGAPQRPASPVDYRELPHLQLTFGPYFHSPGSSTWIQQDILKYISNLLRSLGDIVFHAGKNPSFNKQLRSRRYHGALRGVSLVCFWCSPLTSWRFQLRVLTACMHRRSKQSYPPRKNSVRLGSICGFPSDHSAIWF